MTGLVPSINTLLYLLRLWSKWDTGGMQRRAEQSHHFQEVLDEQAGALLSLALR